MTQTTKHTSTQTPFHFYASNAGMWATTTADRDLPALIKLMEKDGLTFNLFYVPLPSSAPYKIKFYKPDVEGAVYLGTFEPKTKTKRRAA